MVDRCGVETVVVFDSSYRCRAAALMWPWAVVWLWLGAAAAQPPALPHCRPANSAPGLLYVSTLNGEIAAIDTAAGTKRWNFHTGAPLLSSSIHRLELSSGGQWMRLVPSLSGSLYKFSGDNLEPLPISADQLLSSSFKYSDDLVIAGAKETTSFGLSTLTGNVIYECSVTGCVNSSDIFKKNGIYDGNPEIEDPGDILLIRKVTQTVRAFEPRTGHEKWNFSVGQHELSLPPFEGCIMQEETPLEKPDLDLIYKVIVPEGLVCAMDKNAPHRVVWQHKLDSPIVSAWQVEETKLKQIDLFGIPHLPFQNKNYQTFISPAVYIGMHDRQLYIQESVRMQAMVQSSSRQYLGSPRYKDPIVLPWHPLPAQALAEWNSDSTALSSNAEKDHSTTALSILYASEYVNGNGFYLFTEDDRKSNNDPNCNKDGYKIINVFHNIIEKYTKREPLHVEYVASEWGDNENITILVVSLWYYWKEVLLIVIGSLIFYNFFFNKFRHIPTQRIIHRVIVERVDNSNKSLNNSEIQSEVVNSQVEAPLTPFLSRYLNDFTPIKCLGRGGFGIVFEAQNKIDEANYAVKRITLPNTKEKRERVLREVRALAKLEHNNIVRYFNSWLEEPPPDWQDPYEKEFMKGEEFTETYSALPTDSHIASHSKSVKILENIKSIDKMPFDSVDEGYGAFPEVSFRQRSFSVNDSCSIVFANDPDDQSNSHSKTNKSRSKDHKISFYIDSKSNMDDVDGNIIDDIRNAVEHSTSTSDIIFRSDACEIVNESTKSKFVRKHHRNLSLDLRKSRYKKDKSPPCGKMYLYIQMQLCQEKSLREWLKENNSIQLRHSQITKMFDQIVSAVEYVHLQGLIHRDLKPSNIFFSAEGLIKVGDFGLVTTMADPLSSEGNRSSIGPFEYGKEKHTQHVGTHLYMSPEQLRGEPHDFKVDIWSLGLVLLELLVPFDTEMERIGVLKSVRESRFPGGFEMSYPDEHSLLKIMLSPEPNCRPSTFGIRARPPLSQDTDPKFHFSIPYRLPRSSTNSFSI